MKRIMIGALAVSPVLFAPVLCAQDAATPITIGNFENSGSATFGYRFTDVSGYRPKYAELFDLNSGPRLLDFGVSGKAVEGKNNFADDYSINTFGLGGDPFSSVQATIRKSRLYDLRVDFRQSRYYWNRSDSGPLPNGLDALTNNHDWATVRKLGSINLLVHATKNLRVSFEYYRNSRRGTEYTTRSLDYFGAPAAFGGFTRANPYYVLAPSSELSNRATAGLDYTLHNFTLHYKGGYQSFTDSINGSNVASPQRSINIDDPNTAGELLNSLSWVDSRTLHTPVSEFSYTGKVTPAFEMRGDYMFYRYAGPASLAMGFNGLARGTVATVDSPYNVSLTTAANVREPNNIVDQGFTYKVKEWWDVLVDYRYTRSTVDSTADFNSVASGVLTTGETNNLWRLGTSSLNFNMAFTPMSSLLIRAGVRLAKTDIVSLSDGVEDPLLTKRIKSAWPIGSIYWQPKKQFTIRMDADQVTTGTSYTAMTPHTDVGGRFVIRYKPTEKLYIEDSAVFRNRTLLTTSFDSSVRSNATTINYDVSERFAIYAGFSYDSMLSHGLANFLRGTAPISNVLIRDQEVNRVWSGGIRTHIAKRLGVTFTGNFVRSNGLGEITGEAPLYGPMSFPYASGSLFYDFPKLGRLTAQLQRTYYTEQIVTANNFSANILLLSWTRSF